MRRLLLIIAGLWLIADPAVANLSLTSITPLNQQEEGLDFKLTATGQADDVYLVSLNAKVEGGLAELFGVGLFIGEKTTSLKGMITDVPLEIKSNREKDEDCAVQFRLAGALISKSVVYFRCGTGLSEKRYEIGLQNYLDRLPAISWSKAADGLMLGIEQSTVPALFEPAKDWTGPLIIEEQTTDDSGHSHIRKRSNPAGHWNETALIKIHLRNESDKEIRWASDRNLWHVAFLGPEPTLPVAFRGHPRPKVNVPLVLEPGRESVMEFNIREAGDVWPLVPPGTYQITVSYTPPPLLQAPSGAEGERLPKIYDVPAFWRGVISTPPLSIDVRHPK